jgi:lipopolysaccharide transport protein LptA
MPRFCSKKTTRRCPGYRGLFAVFIAMVLCRVALVNAELLDFSSEDSVIVKADSAWEDAATDVVHFSGGFTLSAPDWYVSADTAVVYGKLDDPDKVLLHGSPARIFFLRADSDTDSHTDSHTDKATQSGGAPAGRTEGTASDIEYVRSSNIVKLSGSATLKRDDDVLVSENIEYDVDADRYTASGAGGVNILINANR